MIRASAIKIILYLYMKSLNCIKYRRPLFLQMLIAGAYSTVSISLCTCIWFIFSLILDRKFDIHSLIELISSFLFGILFICIPINLSTILFIHLSGLFKYVMYSFKMIILESSLLIMSNIIIHTILIDMHIEVFYVKSILLISVIVELYSAFVIKKIFHRRYLNFHEELENCHIKPNIDKRVDFVITIASNILILIPCLLFVFILF